MTSVFPDCRSAISSGSLLYSLSGSSGQIGCEVQGGNSWVINSFQTVLAGSLIVIYGKITLPVVSGIIGIGQIITYSNTLATNLYNNGMIIDRYNDLFVLNVATILAMNPNSDIFLTQRSPVRANYIG